LLLGDWYAIFRDRAKIEEKRETDRLRHRKTGGGREREREIEREREREDVGETRDIRLRDNQRERDSGEIF